LIFPEFEAEEADYDCWGFPPWFEAAIQVGAISIRQVNSITQRFNNEAAVQEQDSDLEAAMASDWRYNY
jgi:hypothetical protein